MTLMNATLRAFSALMQ